MKFSFIFKALTRTTLIDDFLRGYLIIIMAGIHAQKQADNFM